MPSNEPTISTVLTLKNWLLDLLFPPTCIGCNQLIKSAEYEHRTLRPGICNKCRETVVIQSSFACAFCHAAVVNGITCPFCRRDHELWQLLVATSYEQPLVKSAIKSFKYQFMRGLADDLGSVMSVYLNKQIKNRVVDLQNTMIVPVPLSTARLRWRGFNQAELLAQSLARTFSLELVPALQRTKNSKPQVDIKNRQDRIANMAGVFTLSNDIASHYLEGKNILLIDDVSTTGSTLEQCARALKHAGAKKITSFVFARN